MKTYILCTKSMAVGELSGHKKTTVFFGAPNLSQLFHGVQSSLLSKTEIPIESMGDLQDPKFDWKGNIPTAYVFFFNGTLHRTSLQLSWKIPSANLGIIQSLKSLAWHGGCSRCPRCPIRVKFPSFAGYIYHY